MRQPHEITHNGKTLKQILDDHAKWLMGDGGERADLTRANLTDANLTRADLSLADLTDANLTDANLTDANLTGANLTGANLAGNKIIRMDFGSWSVCIYADRTQIGCQTHPNDKWLSWTPESEEIKKMARGASEFWAQHREMICAGIRWAMT